MDALGPYGLAVEIGRDDEHLRTAPEIEALGFGALWVNGGQLDRLDRLDALVRATTSVAVGSAVALPAKYGADELGDFYAESAAPARLLIGLGTPAGPRPTDQVIDYARRLDARGVPRERRLLAAFGPRRLNVARHHFGGALPMLFTTEHTAVARRLLGPDRILALGQYVVVDDDPVTARATARGTLSFLFSLAKYVKSAVRQGFTTADAEQLSDRLVDALVAWGSPETISAHLRAQRGAGADHVYVSVLHADHQPGPVTAARLLAPHLQQHDAG